MWSRGLGAIVAASAALWLAAPGALAAKSPAQRLVDTYSPIVMLRAQSDPCDSTQEQYQPTTVDTMLGNRDVELDPPGKNGKVMRAPTAADIAGLDEGYHLDLPGDPLEPGCTYAKDFAALKAAGKAPVTT